ncbi:MAG TPA: two-component regulator propeller domain-containing protein [Bryobacteraceae bacterium]|jgi:signal transduction histidine kinase/ligand-binding sensor domain-containing protein|nr:two-component regulator propeller domain-containing protein [Bryobacteraceae bacterium]
MRIAAYRFFWCCGLVAMAMRAASVGPATQEFARQTWQSENGLPQNTVQAILQSRDGYMWVGTEGGLARFDGVRFLVYNTRSTPELKSNNIRGLLQMDDGALWIATADGVTRLANGRFTHFDVVDGLPGNNVWSLAREPNGALVAVTNTGAAHFDGKRFVASPFSSPRPVSSQITVRFEDSQHTLWTGTDVGLARTVNGRPLQLNAENSFTGETILAITQDREGSIWIGTESGGLSILRAQKFTTFTTRDGLPEDSVRCVFQDRKGVVWIGTDSHGVARYEHGKFTTLTTADGLSSNVTLALGDDANGDLLIGTPDGLNRIHDQTVSTITSAEGLPDDFVRSLATGKDSALWIGTRRGLVRMSGGRATLYAQAQGLGSDVIGAMLPVTENDLWIATLHGLAHLYRGGLVNYTTAQGLSSNIITALYRDSRGILWIGTQAGGLDAFYRDQFIRFPSRLELPETIYGLAGDADGNLWISSDGGIFSVRGRDLLAFVEGRSKTLNVASYGASDGLRISESSGGGHPSIWETNDGSLWFATLKGVAVLRGPHVQMNRVPPPVVIEAVSIDDRSLDPAQVADIGPGHSRVSFEYAGLSFIAPQKVRFRYQLQGFDREWIDAGTRRVAFYTNLPPRQYSFRVMASNNDGFWSTSAATLVFRVEPHIYQTYWFYALVALCMALLGWAAYRWRVRHVEERFSAVLQERNRIAREIHDTLAQGFAGVSVQLELVSRLMVVSGESAREHLDEARMLVRNSLAEARRAIWDLRSQSTESQDFAARVSQMAARVTRAAAGNRAEVKLAVRGTYRPLTPKVEEELLKIAQEAVTNAVRHADAGHIDIELAFDTKNIHMTIADDGRGFVESGNDADLEGHYGLRGMRERAAEIDAQFRVDTGAGKGTRISVETPVH